VSKEKNPAAVELGRKGGRVKSERKQKAALEREARKKARREADKKEEE
jgi:hypothetical protein